MNPMRFFGFLFAGFLLSATTAGAQSFTSGSFGSSTGTFGGGPKYGRQQPGMLSPGLQPAPGVYYPPGLGISPGTMYYPNQPGYYTANPYATPYPGMVNPFTGMPAVLQFGGVGYGNGYWRSPSGYYYPWLPSVYIGGTINTAPSILTVEPGQTQAKPARPPLTVAFDDMRKFLMEAAQAGRLDDDSYLALMTRLGELRTEEKSLREANGGFLSETDDLNLRKKLDDLSLSLAKALNANKLP